MSCSRIFLVALCLCTPLALAQDESLVTGKAANNVQQVPDGRIPPAAPPSEPWRILPKPDIDVQEVPDLRIPAAAAPSEPWRILPKPDWDQGRVVMTPGPEGVIVIFVQRGSFASPRAN